MMAELWKGMLRAELMLTDEQTGSRPTPAREGALVDIVMGTFNGARFLQEQIESLQQQTHTRWRLLVRDDGSSDTTVALLVAASAADARIVILEDHRGNLGFAENFFLLTRTSSAPYLMYCDQDDVWLPEKVERSLGALRAVESVRPGAPALAHCDASIVDERLQPLGRNFIGKRGSKRGLRSMVFANCVQGSALVLNAALRELLLSVPASLPHDFHAALLAECLGTRVFMPEPLLLYRQHDANVLGSGSTGRSPGPSPPVPRLLTTLRYSLDAAPDVVSLLASVEQKADPMARRGIARYVYVVRGVSRLKRIACVIAERYAFLRAMDGFRLMLAIAIGMV